MNLSSRTASAADEPDLVRLAIAMLEETRPGEPYEREVIRSRIRHYLNSADAEIWVVTLQDTVVGFLLGWTIPFDWRSGCCAVVRMQHVALDARETDASDLLMRGFFLWARRQGAQEIVGCSFSPDRVAAMREMLGTQEIGDGTALQ